MNIVRIFNYPKYKNIRVGDEVKVIKKVGSIMEIKDLELNKDYIVNSTSPCPFKCRTCKQNQIDILITIGKNKFCTCELILANKNGAVYK